MKQNYVFYGTKVHSMEVVNFIDHIVLTNNEKEKSGIRKTPLCIWGEHGIGKTQIVEQYAKDNGFKFEYIAPAQFEEMGDLVGMPKIIDDKTYFAPPKWVPQEESQGILLIDDVNRADERILRGIMQLLQNYELVSRKLPLGWQIILTANPDGGDYSVTPMDFAMITRMMHITLVFEPKTWALWAEKNSIDSRGINFVLTYPELVSGQRNTPRSFVQFFECIKSIKDLKEEITMVKMLADSCLDEVAVISFISFILLMDLLQYLNYQFVFH